MSIATQSEHIPITISTQLLFFVCTRPVDMLLLADIYVYIVVRGPCAKLLKLASPLITELTTCCDCKIYGCAVHVCLLAHPMRLWSVYILKHTHAELRQHL